MQFIKYVLTYFCNNIMLTNREIVYKTEADNTPYVVEMLIEIDITCHNYVTKVLNGAFCVMVTKMACFFVISSPRIHISGRSDKPVSTLIP